ncbi:MAG TPA: hypothetical protein VKH45_04480 [Candidatus Acidoferrum sp.]|nr:hypothetical protein [Candidatus Acidoferrum sp.]
MLLIFLLAAAGKAGWLCFTAPMATDIKILEDLALRNSQRGYPQKMAVRETLTI